MTYDEQSQIYRLYEALQNEPFFPSSRWRIAFNLYNVNTTAPLNMGCRPCYGKVLRWLFDITRTDPEMINIAIPLQYIQPKTE